MSEDPVQQQLAAAREAQILAAATELFAEKGFHRATIRDIARRAGIADGTLYSYFGGKDDLLLAILDRLNETERRPADLGRALEGDLQAFMRDYLTHRIGVLWESAALFRALLPELIANEALRERYYAEVIAPSLAVGEQGLAALRDDGRGDPLLPRILAGSILGLLVLHLLGDELIAAERQRLPELLAALFTEGLAGSQP